MTNKIQIKAVIFDIGGVFALGKDLSQNGSRTKGVHEAISKSLGISLDQWFDTIGEIYEKTITGKTTEKQFLSFLSKIFKKDSTYLRNLFFKNYKLNFRQNKSLYKFAEKLNKKYKTAILSDQHPISNDAVVPKNKIKKFDVVVISFKVGLRKPNPSIYKLTLQKLKLRPEECVFIDNQVWNLTPAKKLGIHTILFKNNNQVFRDLKKLGVEV